MRSPRGYARIAQWYRVSVAPTHWRVALAVSLAPPLGACASALAWGEGTPPAGAQGARAAPPNRAAKLMMERGDGRSGAEPDFFAALAQSTQKLLRLAAALVGPDDAEDIVQEAVMRAWQAWPSLRDPAAAGPWLLRITGNVCRDWRRGSFGVRQRLHLPLDGALAERGVSALYSGQALVAAPGADPGSSDHATALDMRRVIGTLDDDLRVVVILRYYIGMDATEIGAALNTAPATIRTRLRRALTILRERLTVAPALASPARDVSLPGDSEPTPITMPTAPLWPPPAPTPQASAQTPSANGNPQDTERPRDQR